MKSFHWTADALGWRSGALFRRTQLVRVTLDLWEYVSILASVVVLENNVVY